MIKKILSVVLIFSMTVGVFAITPENPVIAKENSTSVKLYEFKEYISDSSIKTFIKSYGAMDKSPWSSFSNNYFYSKMNQAQRSFYDGLKAQVEDFFYNEKDAKPFKVAGGETMYGIGDAVSYAGLSKEEAQGIYLIFCNANPQFYFLNNASAFIISNKTYYLVCYPEYANASDRRTTNQRFLEVVNSYLSDIKSYSDKKDERQRRIHTLLAEKLSYASTNSNDWGPHQSSATAVLTGVTVCAGYSELYALLCNAVGIPCICVTSTTHEWNMVQYGEYWYNVDITYDDGGSEPKWNYFNIPNSPSFNSDHIPEPIFYTVGLPKAEYNFGDKPLEIVIKKGTVYRVYNSNNGEHFLTLSVKEKDSLVASGWQDEGKAFVSEVNDKSVPVYRLYNPNTGEHYYTTSVGEKNTLAKNGWSYEKIAFYSSPSKIKAVYMLYNPNSTNAGGHHYTKSYGEAKSLVNGGWQYQKIGWYAVE